MVSMVKMISVSTELGTIIDLKKKKEGHTSYDAVIRDWKKDSDAYKVLITELSKKGE